jgi:hypothetical protein
LIQYVVVGIAGVLGFFSAGYLTAGAVAASVGVWIWAGVFPRFAGDLQISRAQRRWGVGVCAGAFGFLGAMIFAQRFCPPLATDALTYHLPSAVLWLQEKRIAFFQTWFFNPANTYSPLGGSMFIAWLMAPMGNDALARFVQVEAWGLTLFAVMGICRGAGAPVAAAALAGVGAALSRPFISESILAKDDLFVAGFYLCAVGALARQRLMGKFGAARLGVAVGLMLGMKFTALMMLPTLALGVDAPVRAGWRWRKWGTAIGCAAVIAGPWYLRNVICWGNPVFPVKVRLAEIHLAGILPAISVAELRTVNGVWQVISGGYYGLPAAVVGWLFIMWVVAVGGNWRGMLRDPVRRVLVLGPVVGILIFVGFSPQAEVRFLLPVFGLMFAVAALAGAGNWAIAGSGMAAVVAVATSFSTANSGQVVEFAMWGLAAGMIAVVVRALELDVLRLRGAPLCWTGAIVAFGLVVVRWPGYLEEYRNERSGFWKSQYPEPGEMWNFVEESLPARARVAYSNQFMVYPLYGFEEGRALSYVPVREGEEVDKLVFPAAARDGELNELAARAANFPADEKVWREKLRESGVEYLVLGRGGPEMAWVEGDRGGFKKLFENAEGAVYRVGGQ